MRTPAFTKSARFRVTTAIPWTTAVAAMRLSLIGMAFRLCEASPAVPPISVPCPRPRADSAQSPTPRRTSAPGQKDEDPESQFAENDGIDRDVWLMCAKLCHDSRIGRRFRRLTQNVGVDQVLHSASVDSESMGTKKSFCGQARSQSMAPSFRGAARRTRR